MNRPNGPVIPLAECKAILSGTSASAHTPVDAIQALSAMLSQAPIWSDPELIDLLLTCMDRADTCRATLSLLSSVAWRNNSVAPLLIEAGLYSRLAPLVSGSTDLDIVNGSISLACTVVEALEKNPSLTAPINIQCTPLFQAILESDRAAPRWDVIVSQLVHKVIKIMLSLSEGEREGEREVPEADYLAVKATLPVLEAVSHVQYVGINAIYALLEYSKIRSGEHCGLRDMAEAGMIPSLLGTRERNTVDPEVAVAINGVRSRLMADPDLVSYLPLAGRVIERRQLTVSRPFHTYDCVQTGANTCMLLGFKGGWPTAGHIPQASTVILVHDEADESAPPRLESAMIEVPYKGVACGVCMGGKVYVYASGRPVKCCEDELSDIDEAELAEEDLAQFRQWDRQEPNPEPEGLDTPALHVYSLATGQWTDTISLEAGAPSVRYPRGMVAVSDTEFLLVVGPFTVSKWKPLQAWIYNTETGKWKRVANPPVHPIADNAPHDDYYRHTLYGMGVQRGTVHLLGMAGDEKDTYHATYNSTQGTWTDLSSDGLKGSCYQPVGDGLALAVCDYSIAAYDACSGTVGPVLDDIPSDEGGHGCHYATCIVGEYVLLVVSWHRELGGCPLEYFEGSEESVTTCYLLDVNDEYLRQCV
ncbi:hypothetical protein KIPB_003693 [Kipferlia bialata]|uniref:Uncharacterized protein n=1 Tax=Kipferlia bialata TaxID=797122 RepID=A0A9K3CU99_9EUKA|nr:hypothetical protein KIPB_003693 [Kipferlia bialata]|eukprot:g3693.t1